MKTSTLSILFAQELANLRSAEEQIIDALDSAVDAVESPELQDALVTHRKESKQHLSQLKALITDYPSADEGQECEALAGMINKADEVIEWEGNKLVKDLELIAICQRLEHYEIAAYGSARIYAKRLGDDNAVDLLSRIIEEEGHADQVLSQIAEDLLEEIEDAEPAGAR